MATESKSSGGGGAVGGAGAASAVPASADAVLSPIAALIVGEKNERGYPSAIFIVRGVARGSGQRAHGAGGAGLSRAPTGGSGPAGGAAGWRPASVRA